MFVLVRRFFAVLDYQYASQERHQAGEGPREEGRGWRQSQEEEVVQGKSQG